MGSWLTERRLTQVAKRLRSLREELTMLDEQLAQLGDEADDLGLRSIVAESPQAAHDSRDARRHVEAQRRHRGHVVAEIAELEARQDRLLDDLTS